MNKRSSAYNIKFYMYVCITIHPNVWGLSVKSLWKKDAHF